MQRMWLNIYQSGHWAQNVANIAGLQNMHAKYCAPMVRIFKGNTFFLHLQKRNKHHQCNKSQCNHGGFARRSEARNTWCALTRW